MKIKDISQILNSLIPELYAEDFDNVGLIVGNPDWISNKILITLDTNELVIEEAYKENCNLIISFHPLIFKGLKRITQDHYLGRTIIMALKYNIAIYVIHTNLDNQFKGTNYKICKRLGLVNLEVLLPKKKVFKKLITYVPHKYADNLRKKLFKLGAGNIGNYNNCSYNVDGWGTFIGNKKSSPFYGEKKIFQSKKEIAISIIFPVHLELLIIKSLIKNHPYEEVPYEIFELNNPFYNNIGIGKIGYLSNSMSEKLFLNFIKKKMKTSCIRHSNFLNKPVKRIAVIGGSGSFALSSAKDKHADVFISSDFKYHQFFEANNEILIVDIGHYESEQFNKDLIIDILKKKLPNFTIIKSNINTNPIHYFY